VAPGFLQTGRQQPGWALFASDAQQCPQIDWPWCEGVTPSDQDWVEAGFTVVKIVDLANDISVGGMTDAELSSVIAETLSGCVLPPIRH